MIESALFIILLLLVISKIVYDVQKYKSNKIDCDITEDYF
jgi:hypothetical protein